MPILQAIDCGSELMSQMRVFLIVSGTRTVSSDQASILTGRFMIKAKEKLVFHGKQSLVK